MFSVSRWLPCACLTLLTKVFLSRVHTSVHAFKKKTKTKETSVATAMNASSRMCSPAIPIPIVQLHSGHHGNIQIILELPPQLAAAGSIRFHHWEKQYIDGIEESTLLAVTQ